MTADELRVLAQRVAEHGEPANRIYVDAKGKAMWDALAPLVEQGILTDDECLMLLVCLKWGKYPVTHADIRAARGR